MIRAVRDYPLIAFAWLMTAWLAGFFFLNDWQAALSHANLGFGTGAMLGRDFANVFTGGHMILQGMFSDLYDIRLYSAFQFDLLDGAVVEHNYSYSPISFLYVWFFALFSYPVAYALWIILTGAAFVWSAKPYLERAGLPVWSALVIPAFLVNIWAGHYGFVMGALWLGAWRLLDERPRTAGALIGLMAIKPHLALLMPLLLIRRGAWTAFVSAAATVMALVAASAMLFGIDPWLSYVGHTLGYQAAMVDDTSRFFLQMMPAVAPSLFNAGFSGAAAWAGQLVTVVGTVAALWRWMPTDPMRAGLAAACATFLVLPYAFIYDMTAVGVAALILVHRSDWVRVRPLALLTALFTLLLPLTTIFLNRMGLPLAPLALAGTMLLWLSPAGAGVALAKPADPETPARPRELLA